MTYLHEIDLKAEWEKFLARRVRWARYPTSPSTQRAFRTLLGTKVYDTYQVHNGMQFCRDCNRPVFGDANHTHDLEYACSECFVHYRQCRNCADWYAGEEDFTTTLDPAGWSVCAGCLGAHWRYCEHCDGHYYFSRSAQHIHGNVEAYDEGACCVSPAKSFLVRNDGLEALANDVRVTVTLPEGMISAEGLAQISGVLHDHARTLDEGRFDRNDMTTENWRVWHLAGGLERLGDRWQTKEGNYTKRLSKLAYKEFGGLKIPPSVISEIGNIASAHSRAVNFEIATTRQLNMPAAEFANSGSCWWSEYGGSRCAFKTNGGFAIRTFGERPPPDCECEDCGNEVSGGGVNGRVWVIPLRDNKRGTRAHRLKPTFETQEPDAYVLFNGYGTLDGYTGARILSHMVGWTYRRVTFSGSPMYINGGTGYLVAPEELATKYTDAEVVLSVNTHSDLFETEQAAIAAIADITERNLVNA